jgi:hypothetical protein
VHSAFLAGRLVAALTCLALAVPAAASAADRIVVPISTSPGNSSSSFVAGSDDGRKVLFATNQSLVPEDQDDQGDIYQREGGRLTLITGAEFAFDIPATATFVAATPDLSHIVWRTDESLTFDDFDNGGSDLYERVNGQIRLVTAPDLPVFSSFNPILFAGMSQDGEHIVFQTNEGLSIGDFDGVDDVYESTGGSVRLLSPGTSDPVSYKGMSTDGTHVFMTTTSQAAGDTDDQPDVFENVDGAGMTLVTPGTADPVDWAGASGDGTHVYFQTTESLNAVLDTDSSKDVYQRAGGVTTLVSTSATAGNGDFDANFQRASADGSSVLFTTAEAMDPADTDEDIGPFDDLYLRSGGTTALISGGETFDSSLVFSSMTPDAAHIFWYSAQSFGDDNDFGFIDSWHWHDGTIDRISVGEQDDQGFHDDSFAAASGDLSSFFFQSDGQLTAGDTDVWDDIYERDGDTTRLITPTPAEPCTVEPVSDRCIPKFKGVSHDGDRVWFTADENLHPLDDDVVVDDPSTPFEREDASTTDVYESRVVGTPTVDATDDTLDYQEGDPQAIDPDLTVTEDTDDVFGATVTITSGFEPSDVVGFQDQPGITGSLNPAGDKLTLTGRGTAADFENALRSVTYTTTSESPSSDTRTVEFSVTNGGNTGSDTRAMTVTAVNDAPALTLGNAAGDFAEDAAPAAIAPELDIGDPDSPSLAGATVRITSGYATGEDELAFTPAGNVTGSLNAEGDTLTLSGSDTIATYESVLRSVTYEDISDQPSDATRTFEFVVNDGDTDSAPLTHSFAVIPSEDPTAVETTHSAVAYTENSAAKAIDPDVDLTDPDSTVIDGASVSISGGFAPGEDVLGFTDQSGIAGSLDAAGDKLTLTGSATASDYVAALRSVTYRDTSDDPSGAERTVTFAVVGGAGSDSRAIDVTPVDDAPVVQSSGGAVGYTEGGSPVAVAPALTIADVDSTSMTGATVRIDDDYQSGADSLAEPAGPLPGGLTAQWNASTATLSVAGAAPLATYRDVLRGVTFSNGSDAPAGGTRGVSFAVSSAAATASPLARTVAVTPVNDPPAVSIAGTPLAYADGDDPVAIDPALTVTDPDSQIQGATVRLISGDVQGEDVLAAAVDRDDGIGIAVDPGERLVTLNGPASTTAYRTALRDIVYSNRAPAATGTRVVQVQLTDGPDVSAPVTRTITLGTSSPVAMVAPAITGANRVGATLTATGGQWRGTQPMTFELHWQRCSAGGTGCTDIDGATDPGYVVQAGDTGSRLRVRVLADNAAPGHVEAMSAVTPMIHDALGAPLFEAGPPSASRDGSAVLRFSGESGANFTCALDGSGFADCQSPLVLTGLADGEHLLRVRQHVEGVASPAAQRLWTVDTHAPAPPHKLAGPDPVTAARSASLSFAGEPGERFQCALDDDSFAACESPFEVAGLGTGAHSILVRAIDAAGNVGDPLRVRWLVDPAARPGGRASSLTLRAPARISPRAHAFEVGCRLDAGTLDRCVVIAKVRLDGRLLWIGRGIAAPGGAHRSAAALVRLPDWGAKRLRLAGPGAVIHLSGRAWHDRARAPLTDAATMHARARHR